MVIQSWFQCNMNVFITTISMPIISPSPRRSFRARSLELNRATNRPPVGVNTGQSSLSKASQRFTLDPSQKYRTYIEMCTYIYIYNIHILCIYIYIVIGNASNAETVNGLMEPSGKKCVLTNGLPILSFQTAAAICFGLQMKSARSDALSRSEAWTSASNGFGW